MKNIFGKTTKKAMPVLPAGRQAAKRGFSLLEVMLVVMILSVALLVFIQVTSKSVVHSIESQDSIIAAGLAQEGVELVKNIRDNNWAVKKTAFEFPFPSDGDCRIDYDSTTCSSGSPELKFDPGSRFYSDTGSETTKFFRKINIRTEGDTRVVTSYVLWSRPWSGSGFSDPDLNNCNPAHKCVYTTITLTQWGGE
jgi:prepilin-type N-terminal cleavage/methylation domain-containing protein